MHKDKTMLKRVSKGIWYNTSTKHFEIRFTFKDPRTGKKTRPHFVAKIKLADGTIRYAQNKEEGQLAISLYIANGGPIEEVILSKKTALLSDSIKSYKDYCLTLGKKRCDLIESYCNYFFNSLADYYYKGNLVKAEQNITVSQIETIDFIRYMSKRQKDKVCYETKEGAKWTGRFISNATINREMNSIKGLFSYLHRIIKIIGENPCNEVNPLPVQKKPKNPMTAKQESIILNESKKDYTFYVMLLMFDTLGPRRSEVHQLKWENLHLEGNNVFCNGFVDFVDRKNGENLRLPLSKDLREALSKLPRLSEYVFTNPDTGTKYLNRYKKLNNILSKAGVKKLGVGYHIFRHNTSNNLENDGAEASTIGSVLGNSPAVVASTYINQGAKRKQEVIDINGERIRNIVKRQEINKNVQETSKNQKYNI